MKIIFSDGFKFPSRDKFRIFNRIKVEQKTRNILVNIRINGTLLGFAMGFLISGSKVFLVNCGNYL